MIIDHSPYDGTPMDGLRSLVVHRLAAGRLDLVSIGDLLRTGFVYPPNSIFTDVKLSGFGSNAETAKMVSGLKYGRARETPPIRPNSSSVNSEIVVEQYHEYLVDSVRRSCSRIDSPWFLQSGGKDSTSLAIAISDARPDATCITYAGRWDEEELDSARAVALKLGLRHRALVCEPGRAYDRYLATFRRMPLLTGDFALLSYVDLAVEIELEGGSGVVDGLGSDIYFGAPVSWRQKVLDFVARDCSLPDFIANTRLQDRSFKLSYILSTLQMTKFERLFPGSRFTSREVNQLFGCRMAESSKARGSEFAKMAESLATLEERRELSIAISENAGAFAKGLYVSTARGLDVAFPFCDRALRQWVASEVPDSLLTDWNSGINKVLVRKHISKSFSSLPYVAKKGSFRFDITGLARERYDTVRGMAECARTTLPGAGPWLDKNRTRLDNKCYASKFYLLALVLPWLNDLDGG